MADIVYTYGNQAYLNITNACPCRCTFCIRNNGDSVGEATTLWFEHNPSIDEIKAEIDAFDFSKYNNSITICGYGEPTCALNNLIDACKYLREKGVKIRLNTNGLSDLINKSDCTAEKMEGLIDAVSISLNASDAEKYAHTNALYEKLAKAFMPGPLTVVLPKRENIPCSVTGGSTMIVPSRSMNITFVAIVRRIFRVIQSVWYSRCEFRW